MAEPLRKDNRTLLLPCLSTSSIRAHPHEPFLHSVPGFFRVRCFYVRVSHKTSQKPRPPISCRRNQQHRTSWRAVVRVMDRTQSGRAAHDDTACVPCRRARLPCDRGLPCARCIRTGCVDECRSRPRSRTSARTRDVIASLGRQTVSPCAYPLGRAGTLQVRTVSPAPPLHSC